MTNKGYTLMELMLVILIISSLILIFPKIETNKETEINRFLEILQQDIYYGLHHSQLNCIPVKITFNRSAHYYALSDSDNNVIKKVSYPSHIEISYITSGDQISMSHGNTSQYYYFYCSSGDIRYKIDIYRKSGIIHATKQ